MKLTNFYSVAMATSLLTLFTMVACMGGASRTGSFGPKDGNGSGQTQDSAKDWPQATLDNNAHLMGIECGQGNILGRFSAYTNADVDPLRSRSTATRAIIVLHDANRNAANQLSFVLKAIAAHPEKASPNNTLVVAPWFISSASQLPAGSSISSPLYWTSDSYMEGGNSSGPVALSSFVLIDSLLQAFSNEEAFPQLTTVSIVGHSAGGQTSQRYAIAGNQATQPAGSTYSLHYGIANPSSYCYLDARRPQTGTSTFSVPSTSSSCTTYDQWKYGLQKMPTKFRSMTSTDRANAYLDRSITYALGTSDNNPNDTSMDTGCEASLQGNTRLRRGRSFYGLVKDLDPTTVQTLCEVPGVAHDTNQMLNSSCITDVMFR